MFFHEQFDCRRISGSEDLSYLFRLCKKIQHIFEVRMTPLADFSFDRAATDPNEATLVHRAHGLLGVGHSMYPLNIRLI